MLLHLIWTTLLGLAASLPVELESSSLAIRDAGTVMPLEARYSSGVTYSINQNFIVYSAVYAFNGPFDPDGVNFYYQGDGNFVIYYGQASAGNPAWSSGTAGYQSTCSSTNQCYLSFLSNGNLVIYIAGNLAWQSGTAGRGYTVAFMGSAPYIVIYNKANSAIWTSGGASNPTPPPSPCARGVDSSCP